VSHNTQRAQQARALTQHAWMHAQCTSRQYAQQVLLHWNHCQALQMCRIKLFEFSWLRLGDAYMIDCPHQSWVAHPFSSFLPCTHVHAPHTFQTLSNISNPPAGGGGG
jgi:hypothetical protein